MGRRGQNKIRVGQGPQPPEEKGPRPRAAETVLLEALEGQGPFSPPCKFRPLLLDCEIFTSAQNSCSTLAEASALTRRCTGSLAGRQQGHLHSSGPPPWGSERAQALVTERAAGLLQAPGGAGLADSSPRPEGLSGQHCGPALQGGLDSDRECRCRFPGRTPAVSARGCSCFSQGLLCCRWVQGSQVQCALTAPRAPRMTVTPGASDRV